VISGLGFIGILSNGARERYVVVIEVGTETALPCV